MISKDLIKTQLLTESLNCGSRDIDFLVNLVDTIENKQFKINGKEWFLYYVDKEGDVVSDAYENLKINFGNEQVEFNGLVYQIHADLITQLHNLYKMDVDLFEHTNYLDSGMRVIDEDKLRDALKDELTEEQVKEVIDIIENFG